MKRAQSALQIRLQITSVFKPCMKPDKTPVTVCCPVIWKAGELFIARDNKALEPAPREAHLEELQR